MRDRPRRAGPSARDRSHEDTRFMRRALALAARGLGETNPNPVVGCVVVRDGRVVGEGFHRRAGRPHAEAMALARAGERARDATLYVTLEPCAHHGRTPPCAPLVRDAGVARVVCALGDPNPLVAGRGNALLRRAGVRVETGLLGAEAARLNERFLARFRLGRPFVLLKAALTLDGRIATAGGHSRWITSPAQRRQARWLRRLHDAVLVGVSTVRRDDPLLLPSPRTERTFTRVVLDTTLRMDPGSRLARSAGAGTPVLALCVRAPARRRRALVAQGIEVVEVAARRGRVSPRSALAALARRGIGSVMVEGGGEVLGSFLEARLLDQVALFRAPLLLGGRDSLAAFGGRSPRSIRGALRLSPVTDWPALAWPFEPQFELWRPRR